MTEGQSQLHSQPEVPEDPRAQAQLARNWMLVCVTAAIVAFFLILPTAYRVRQPGATFSYCLPAFVSGIVLLLFALAMSHVFSAQGLVRAGFIFSILFALVLLAAGNMNYYNNFYDFHWYLVALTFTIAFFGGWFLRHRWLSVLTLGAAVVFLTGAWWPPSARPISIPEKNGDLQVTLQSLESDRAHFLVESISGANVKKEYVLEKSSLSGRAARGLLPVRCWRPSLWSFDGDPADEALLSAHIFPPSWPRSLDLALTIPLSDSKGALFFEFTRLPNPGPGEIIE